MGDGGANDVDDWDSGLVGDFEAPRALRPDEGIDKGDGAYGVRRLD